MSRSTPTAADQEIRSIAERCVMCGLCLPHCPSYRVARQEAESPRGRLALMARIAAGELDGSRQPTLDTCLGCGQCEPVCPAQVPFLRALTLTRSTHAPATETAMGWAARRLAQSSRLSRTLLRALILSRRHLPQRWRGRLNLDGLARLKCADQPPPARAEPEVPSAGRSLVVLCGCGGDSMETRAISALQHIAVVARVGLRIERATCCGALAAHLGHTQHLRAPELGQSEDVAVINSGCTAHWRGRLAPVEVAGIADCLERLIRTLGPRLRHRAARVAMHFPCSQRGIAGEAAALERLLRLLPGVELVGIPAQPGCCGAAGTYFLNQPEISRQLAQEMTAAIAALRVDLVVSCNGGCRAQLGQSLHDVGSPLPVLHPAELVALHLATD